MSASSEYWVFTANINMDEMRSVHHGLFRRLGKWWITKQETSTRLGLHFQGAIRFKRKNTLEYLQRTFGPQWHWEIMLDQPEACDYCDKLDTAVEGGIQFRYGKVPTTFRGHGILDREQLRPWQIQLENIALSRPDSRDVHWVYDPAGGIGKSSFVKYCNWYHTIPYTTGGQSGDIIYSIKDDLDRCRTVLVDYPRNLDPEEYNYDAIENLKNGMVTHTKYKSDTQTFGPKNLIIFSNHLPVREKLSEDRWKVWKIDDGNLTPVDSEEEIELGSQDTMTSTEIEVPPTPCPKPQTPTQDIPDFFLTPPKRSIDDMDSDEQEKAEIVRFRAHRKRARLDPASEGEKILWTDPIEDSQPNDPSK